MPRHVMPHVTSGHQALTDVWRDSFDPGDPWGSNVSWLFAIADALWHADSELVPADWEYVHSSACVGMWSREDDWPDGEIVDLIECGTVTSADLLSFGVIVNRYDEWCRLAKLNY